MGDWCDVDRIMNASVHMSHGPVAHHRHYALSAQKFKFGTISDGTNGQSGIDEGQSLAR